MFNLTIHDLILINQYSQELVKKQTLGAWFDSFSEQDKKDIIKLIWQLALQAQLTENDIHDVVIESKIKKTLNPVKMLLGKKYPFSQRGYNLMDLDGIVLNQAFYLLLECLKYADKRRKRNEEPLRCNHWWHRDLSNSDVVNQIISDHNNK